MLVISPLTHHIIGTAQCFIVSMIVLHSLKCLIRIGSLSYLISSGGMLNETRFSCFCDIYIPAFTCYNVTNHVAISKLSPYVTTDVKASTIKTLPEESA